MSYGRTYNETVTGRVYKTVYVDYPASERGGSTSYTIDEEVDIPIEVNIEVDTDPFDDSVQNCGNNVDLLTTAVVATETAEVVSKEVNSRKVADTIVGGFFSYIRSEISQQIAELSQNTSAQLMHLKELAQSCVAKKKQMEGDYNRISGRYVKIFGDLNNELSNRIYELDKPAFVFKKETDNQNIRTSDNDLVNTVAIFGMESSDLQSKISASIAKKRALDSLNKAKLFLWQQKRLNMMIQQSMLNESLSGSIFSPVFYTETVNSENQISENVLSTGYLSILNNKAQKNELLTHFASHEITWSNLTPGNQKSISLYFNIELNRKLLANDQHSIRVREMIQKLANLSLINVINFQQV